MSRADERGRVVKGLQRSEKLKTCSFAPIPYSPACRYFMYVQGLEAYSFWRIALKIVCLRIILTSSTQVVVFGVRDTVV